MDNGSNGDNWRDGDNVRDMGNGELGIIEEIGG